LARDLHDGAQQQLVAAVLRLQMAQDKWNSDPTAARALLDAGIEQAEAGVRSLRELVAGIHPAILVHRGLGAAVDSLAAGAPLLVKLNLMPDRLPAPMEASLYFFVSEALANIIKHAHASEASIDIDLTAGVVVIEVNDNGVGGAKAKDGGTGLQGLEDRVGALAGTLSLVSEAGGGTTLRAEIPVPLAEAG
jgi:signal transduction histidine kinase